MLLKWKDNSIVHRVMISNLKFHLSYYQLKFKKSNKQINASGSVTDSASAVSSIKK